MENQKAGEHENTQGTGDTPMFSLEVSNTRLTDNRQGYLPSTISVSYLRYNGKRKRYNVYLPPLPDVFTETVGFSFHLGIIHERGKYKTCGFLEATLPFNEETQIIGFGKSKGYPTLEAANDALLKFCEEQKLNNIQKS